MSENEHVDPQDERPGSTAWIPYVIASLRRYIPLILLVAFVGLCFGVLGALTTPNQYRSVGKLIVIPGIRDTITPESAFLGADASATRSSPRESMQNELQVLKAPKLFDKVVEQLGADHVLAPYDPAGARDGTEAFPASLFHDFQSWWFDAANKSSIANLGLAPKKLASMMLARSVRIFPEAGSNVISFIYESHSPELARDVVSATMQAAQEVHGDVFNTLSSLAASEEELEKAKLAVSDAEEALLSFRKENLIYDHAAQRDELLASLSELTGKLVETDVGIERKKAEIVLLTAQLALIPQESEVSGAERSVMNPEWGSLRAHLRQLELEEFGLDNRLRGLNLTPSEIDRQKAHLARMIKETKASMEQESLVLKLDGGKEKNPRYQLTRQDIDSRVVEVQGLTKEREKLAEAQTTVGKDLAKFEAMLPTLRTLEEDAKQKLASRTRLKDGVDTMRTVQQLEQLKLSNIRPMYEATYEPIKIGPQRGKQVFMAGFAGAVLGSMLALLLAWRDRKVRGAHDLAILGVPAEGVRGNGLSKREPVPKKAAIESLPPEFQEVGQDIARFWATLPYDHRSTEGLKVAFLPSGEEPDAGLAAATLAIGLAAYGGERVVYVSCATDNNWLAQRLGIEEHAGWSEVLRDGLALEKAIAKTSIAGLSYLPMGSATGSIPHPIAGPAFASLLDKLSASHRFVVVEMPCLTARPEGQSVLGVIDATELVARTRKTTKAAVREAVASIKAANAQLIGAVLQRA